MRPSRAGDSYNLTIVVPMAFPRRAYMHFLCVHDMHISEVFMRILYYSIYVYLHGIDGTYIYICI